MAEPKKKRTPKPKLVSDTAAPVAPPGPPAPPATMAQKRGILRAMTRGAYDLQRLRIDTGLRLCANFRAKLTKMGEDTSIVDADTRKAEVEEIEEKAEKLIGLLKKSYARLTDGVAKNRTLPDREGFTGDDLISDYSELALISQYLELEKVERGQFSRLPSVLTDFPIYNSFLQNVTGIGPALAAIIISEFDIHKARYPSSLWAYAGLDVAKDGLGRSRRKDHLVPRQYKDKDGNDKERQGITFNPMVKTKLTGVMGPSFLRTGSPYRKIYDDYKHRLETDPKRQGWEQRVKDDPDNFQHLNWRKKRLHDMAIRYMVKMFLCDLYNAWRPLEGLVVEPTYAERKFGIVHSRKGPMAA